MTNTESALLDRVGFAMSEIKSAHAPKAGGRRTLRPGAFVPRADISRQLLDHLVGAQQERLRHLEAKHLGRGQVED